MKKSHQRILQTLDKLNVGKMLPLVKESKIREYTQNIGRAFSNEEKCRHSENRKPLNISTAKCCGDSLKAL